MKGIDRLAYTRMADLRDFSPDDTKFRLPKDVKPVHYDLFLHPNLETGLFNGNVTILIDLLSKKNYISLHQKDLNITKTTLRSYEWEENQNFPVKETETIKELDQLVVKFDDNLNPGLYELSFEFDGALQPNKIVGFYSSQYVNSDKVTRKIATSKFEPTYARRAFPCFDEPDLKAQFSVKLVQPNDNYNALSNMDVESTVNNKPEYGLTTVKFSKSVPMSTYLTCFIVSDFVGLTGIAKKLDNVSTFPVSVYTTFDQKKKAKFALDIGIEIIEYYTNLFKFDYPLPKLDMAAIPDFVSGAMENWGLITYREARLLYDETIHSKTDKENVALVIAHEFAHMWFGNLVTMEWWNDLWLNEGFASFMQYRSVDAIRPEWGMMEIFVLHTYHTVFVTDAKLSSHPIVQTVNTPDEITALFDVITYQKGAAVLCMLDNFLTSEIFNAGVITYLHQFQFRNAKTSDLFDILQKTVGNKINLTSIMNTWTKQMGFPVVTVVKNGKSNFTLTQKRFLLDSEAKFDPTESEYGYKWTIPITYVTDKNSTPTLVWFDKDEERLELKLDFESIEWIKFNHKQVGYYRVKYADDDWDNLLKVLKSNHKTLTSIDRANLIEDAFSLAQASEIDYKIAMDMTSYLVNERNSTPWNVAANKLLTLDKLLFSTNITSKYRDYVKKIIVTDIYTGVDDFNNHDVFKLRSIIFNLACSVGHEAIINEVSDTFKQWINFPNDVKLDPDLKSIYYKYGMKYVGTEHEWDIVYQRFINETNATEKLKLMRGLAAVRSSYLLSKYINIAVDQSIIRSQDTFDCLQAIASNPIGTPLVWDWIRENWLFLVERYTLNDRNLGRLIPDITKTFATDAKLEEMKNFFKKYPESGAGKDYRVRALETVSNNVKWLKKNSGQIEKWLDSYFKE